MGVGPERGEEGLSLTENGIEKIERDVERERTGISLSNCKICPKSKSYST